MFRMSYRDEIWGMGETAAWRDVLPEQGLDGLAVTGSWVRGWDSVTGDGTAGAAQIVLGEEAWRDYELRVLVTPREGGNVQIPFRISPDGKRGYLLDVLLGWQALGVSRFGDAANGDVEKLSVVNHEFRCGTEYELELAVRGHSITSYVNGVLVNQVTAFDHPAGKLALSLWRSKATFRRPQLRRLG